MHLARTDREHEGLSFFTKSDLKVEILMQFPSINENIEIYTSRTELGDSKCIISAIYGSNSEHIGVTNIINELLNNETFRLKKSIVIGDLNINLLEHSITSPKIHSKHLIPTYIHTHKIP